VIACNFPMCVPAVTLQSDARETALASGEPLDTIMDLPASPLDRSAPAVAVTDGRQFAAIVSDVMTSPVEDCHWVAGHVIRTNRQQIAPLDRGPAGMESTDRPARSAVI
jgi:hypothetical protein